MNTDLPDPERWSDLPVRGTAAENAIGAAFRRVKDATLPPEAAVVRLAPREEAPAGWMSARLAWRVVLVAALIMATGSAVGAALHRWRRAAAAARAEVAAPVASVDPARARVRGRQHLHDPRLPAAPEAAERFEGPEAPEAPEAAVVVAEPAPKPAAARPSANNAHRPPAPAPERVPSLDPSSESGVLANVFRDLRSSGDAAAALRSLDEYERRFPTGLLRSEARIARAEALLVMDRRRDALPLLEGLEESGGAPTRDVRITRAELLAEAGRCGPAVRDFDAVLAVSESDTAGGRALYGRASCRLAAGQTKLAAQDLGRYVRLHPDGPFAPAARRVLGSPP